MNTERLDKFRLLLKEHHLDAFLVSNYYNIFYLSGFATLVDNEREAWLLVTSKDQYLFSDERYLKNQKSKDFRLLTPENGLIKQIQNIVDTEKIVNIGFESEDLKFSEFEKFNQYLKNIKFVATDRLLVKQRAVKYSHEIKALEEACLITDQCFNSLLKNIKVGTSEKEIAFKMELYLKEKGHDFSFYPIIAVDKNSAIAHYDTRTGNNERVKDGSIILVDFGVKYKKYLSDMTRMIFVGHVNNEVINTYNKLEDVQKKTIQYLSTTNDHSCREVDKYCRRLLVEYGLPTYSHSTGHGVGLDIHEYPKISYASDDVIEKNQVITIEPGIYLDDKWGMRIEDTVLIDENMNPVVLTKSRKELLVLK